MRKTGRVCGGFSLPARATGVVVVAACVALGGCGGDPGRPSTPATLRIVSPAARSVTGRDLDVRVRLQHARITDRVASQDQLRSDEGHIHVYLDGEPIAMTYGTRQPLRSLQPGPHWVRAEFVAADHLPFDNRVESSVTFTVR